MKKFLILLLLLSPFISSCTVYTSIAGGGNWNSTATWGGTPTTPGSTDTVIIATTGASYVLVNVNSTINKVTVNSGAKLDMYGTLTVQKILVNNGAVNGSAYEYIFFTGSGTVLSGGGDWTGYSSYLEFQGSPQTIDATVNMTMPGAIVMNTANYGGNMKITNNGSITLTGTVNGLYNNGTHSTTWVNAANSYVSVSAPSWKGTNDTLYASATGNTVVLAGSFGATVKNPVSATYYNLTIATGPPITMPNNFNANNVTVNSGDTLNMSADSLFLTGTWSHPGVVINHSVINIDTSVVKVSGVITQKVPPAGYKITSTATGGDWNTVSSWVHNIVPGIMDTVVIATTGGNYIRTYTSTIAYKVTNVTINSGAILYLYAGDLTVRKLMTNSSSGTFKGGKNLYLTLNSGTVVRGGGDWSSYTGVIYFQGSNQTIDASATAIQCSWIYLDTQGLGGNVKVTNNGSCTLTSTTRGVQNSGSTYSTTWVNASNSSITQSYQSWALSKDTLYASATGNTIIYKGTINYSIKVPKSNTYYNLTINSSNTVTLGGATTVSKALTVTSGTLACGTYQLTGNASGTFTISSGAAFTLGLTTSATVPTFPSAYTSGDISFDPNSTVTYQANASTQTISTTPTAYGNLILSTGTVTTSSKNTATTSLTVAGSLIISSSNVTLAGLNSGGSLTLGGNFTNNGTFTYGTSTVTLNGTLSQTLGGSTSTTFYNLTGSSSANDSIILANNETVSSNFAISTGTFILAGNSYNLTVEGNLTNSGTLTASSGTVTMNGTTQTLSGSNAITLYKLVIASGTTTLNGNLTCGSDLTINSGGASLNASTYTIYLKGNFTTNGTFTYSTSTVSFIGSTNQNISGSTYPTFYNLTINGLSGQTVYLGAAQTVNHNLTISSGILDVNTGSYSLTVTGNFTKTGGTFTPRSGTVTMNNGTSQTLGGSSLLTMNKLIIYSGTTSLGGAITTNSDITINSGATLDVTSSNCAITIGGNWTDNGSFIKHTGTVTFDAAGKQCVSGSETFYNLIISSLTTLATPTTITITGTITILPGGQMACSC